MHEVGQIRSNRIRSRVNISNYSNKKTKDSLFFSHVAKRTSADPATNDKEILKSKNIAAIIDEEITERAAAKA